MKHLFKSLCIAISIYSKIPVPIFDWKEEDMKYHLIFFPFVGIVIGALLLGWQYLRNMLSIGNTAFILITAVIPILITGGFHVDGFMDTCDALSSYGTIEKKREILKDPHIGAFSVIMLVTLMLIYLAGLSELKATYFPIFCLCFVLSRALSGISVMIFPKSGDSGMVHTFAKKGDSVRKSVVGILMAEALICIAAVIYLNLMAGLMAVGMILLIYFVYYRISVKQFGGISGDLAGFFVTVSETGAAVILAILSILS